MDYKNYEVTIDGSNPIYKNQFYAWKENAANINGLSFSHSFYFVKITKPIEGKQYDTVNGKKAFIRLTEGDYELFEYNYLTEDGIVRTQDLKNFFFTSHKDGGLKPITLDEIANKVPDYMQEERNKRYNVK